MIAHRKGACKAYSVLRTGSIIALLIDQCALSRSPHAKWKPIRVTLPASAKFILRDALYGAEWSHSSEMLRATNYW